MVRATDLLFGKIVVRNQLATEAVVRECLQALASDGGGATLGDVMVRRGLLTSNDAEKARHAAALAQAQRYLKFGQEMGVLSAEAGQRAIDELRRRQYRVGVGRVLLELGMPRELHDAIVSRDPKTLGDTDAVSPAAAAAPAPPFPAAAPPPPAPPAVPVAPAPAPPAPPPPPPAQPPWAAPAPSLPAPPPPAPPPQQPPWAAPAPALAAPTPAPQPAWGAVPPTAPSPPPPAPPPSWGAPPPGAGVPPAWGGAPPAPPPLAPPSPARGTPAAAGRREEPQITFESSPKLDLRAASAAAAAPPLAPASRGAPALAPAGTATALAPAPPPPATLRAPSPVPGAGSAPTLPLPPGAPAAPVLLHGSARELVAVALRDGLLQKSEVDAVLAAGPPQIGSDGAALADALVASRVLARPQADLIQAFVTVEREDPQIEVEGFYLVAPLGFDIYGPVFRARRAGGARPNETPDVALEVMPLSISRDARRNDEFRRLCGYLPTAEHPALVKAVETGMSGTLTFIARENPAGVTLAERIAKKVLPEADALDLGRALVDALGALALVGIAHGAVRPENVVLTPDGRWILRHIGATPAPLEWDPEEQPPCADLPRWLAPEVIAGHPHTPRSDMYSLGLVLFAAATGRAPYDGPTSAAVIARHLEGKLPDPATLGANLSPRFYGMLKVLCQPDPAQRYRDPVELLEELEALRGGAIGAGDPESTLLYSSAGGGPSQPIVGEDSNDRTMVGSAEEDADLKEMRRLAAERRKQKAAEAAGLLVGDASGPMGQPGAAQKGGDPLVGVVLSGRYRIVKKIGAGGMGTVYLAEHLLLHKNVALKILHPKLLENQEAISRFDREVKASSRFQHPGVVQIFDAGEDVAASGAKLHYMVMEYVEGEDLHKIVAREGALPPARACRIFRQVLPAIDEAHKKGIVHRDMKTDNIMVMKAADGSDVAKIMDFGIAKIIEGQDSGNTGLHGQQQFKTRKGVITGTPQYMSPEQASGHPDIDGRSDLYSFGVIMYEMVLGELPFKSNTAMGYLGKHIVEPPIPVKEVRPDLDIGLDLERIIMRCLEKDKTHRFQTAAEILRDLEETVFPPVLGTAPPAGTRRKGGGGARLARTLALCLVLAGLGAGGYYGYGMWLRQRHEARAAHLRAASEAVGRGDVAAARAALALAGDEGDPAVKSLREAIERIEAERRRVEARATLLAEAEKAAQAGDLALAKSRLDEARAGGATPETERIAALVERREREARARSLEARGDKAAADGDPEAAKARYQEAIDLGGASPELVTKLARARARISAREAEALREAGDDAGAAEKLREALRALPPDDADAKDLDERLRAVLGGYEERLRGGAPAERQAYFEALLAKAAEYDGRREFVASKRYYRDALIFCPESRSIEMSQMLREADARAEEQRQFEKARDVSQSTRAKAVISPIDRTIAEEELLQYLRRFGAVEEGASAPRGHFVDEAKEELEELRKAIAAKSRG
jgi:serine/threonine protein kinase